MDIKNSSNSKIHAFKFLKQKHKYEQILSNFKSFTEENFKYYFIVIRNDP
jgi:hypothetical protein